MTQISNSEDIIQMKDVSLYQNDFQVLREVNLKLKEGEFAYLIGKTGSGKSTLLKSLYTEEVFRYSFSGFSVIDRSFYP